MTDGIASQHLTTAVQHMKKVRAYLGPRTRWSAEYAAADALAEVQQAVAALAAAVQRVMVANGIDPDFDVLDEEESHAATRGELDGQQLAKVAAFVTRMEKWFAQHADARVEPGAVSALCELFQILLEVVRAAEAAMSHNQLGFQPFRVPPPAAAVADLVAEKSASELPDHISRLCPKCGAPRVAGSEDCPACGVIYARAVQQAVEDGQPESLRDSGAEQLYEAPGGVADDAPLPPPPPPRPVHGLDRLRRAIDEDTWIFVAVVLLVYLGVVGFLSARLIGGTDSVRHARDVFHEATGRKMRYPLPKAMSLNWVDHRFVYFTSSDQGLQLMLYTEGVLAKKTDLSILKSSVAEMVRGMDLPLDKAETVRGRIGASEIQIQVMKLGEGNADSNRAYLSVFENEKGWPVVLFLVGPYAEVRELAREVFVGES